MVVKLMSSFEQHYQKFVLKLRTGIAWEKVNISRRHQRWFPRSEERAQNLQTDDVSLARSG